MRLLGEHLARRYLLQELKHAAQAKPQIKMAHPAKLRRLLVVAVSDELMPGAACGDA
jgi:hypothetical protein